MSVSREELNYWREQVERLEARDKVWMEINISTAYRLLDDLEAKDEHIADLTSEVERLRRENRRLTSQNETAQAQLEGRAQQMRQMRGE